MSESLHNDSGRAREYSFGLFLNFGSDLADTDGGVFEFTHTQAALAAQLGYRELWVTEHHFIPFGINSSALTTSAYLLGQHPGMTVGTAVALAPIHHPVDLAERAAILDQLSGGRFELGIGRGGYARDFEVFGVDPSRWDIEPEASARLLLEAWREETFDSRHPACGAGSIRVRPRPATPGGPALLLATASERGVGFAAQHGLALQHYFATPATQRTMLEDAYRAVRPDGPRRPHLHTLLLLVADDEEAARRQLTRSLTRSFGAGEHPAVPQAQRRHVDGSGKPLNPAELAARAAHGALVGPPGRVAEALSDFIEHTGARRLCFYMEAIAEPTLALESVERFMREVVPRLPASRW